MPIDVAKVNNILIEKGLNYSDLAEKSGISRTQISRMVNCKISKSNTKTISKLVKALGVEYKDICKEGGE